LSPTREGSEHAHDTGDTADCDDRSDIGWIPREGEVAPDAGTEGCESRVRVSTELHCWLMQETVTWHNMKGVMFTKEVKVRRDHLAPRSREVREIHPPLQIGYEEFLGRR